MIHPALLAAFQPQPVPALTATEPVTALALTERLDGEIPGAQGTVNENPFDAVLAVTPPGPTAVTRASYVTPGVSGAGSSGRKSTRIRLLASGAGLPRFTVVSVDEPCGYTESE